MNALATTCLSTFLLCATAAPAAPSNQGVVLWQIGRPDKSYAEFAIARNYPAFERRFGNHPVVFQVGRSVPARDWPFIQPGPADAWAGNREHPFTIRFSLKEPPRGMFLLKIDFTDVQAGVPPVMLVQVGGHTGRFALHPGGGDASLTDPSAGRPEKIEVALPASFFRQGTNEIRLTATQGSWVEYDAITLSNAPDMDTAQVALEGLSVTPTPFYVRQGGKPRRVLNVSVSSAAASGGMKLLVRAGGETEEIPVEGGAEFGNVTREITVPDSVEPLEATITARDGAHERTMAVRINPGRKWKVYVGASAHTDIGYTDLQPKCAARHNQNTDFALDLMEKYPDFKWNLEVAWQAENYLNSRPPGRVAQFLKFARAGRLGVQALYCNILTGLCSHEAACRLTWFAHTLKTRYGVPYRSAMISDVPTQEASLPMLLANSGIPYFSSGINNDRAYTFTHLQHQCPCWWEGPDGSRVLMMYAPQYAQASQWGLTRSLDTARSAIVANLKNYQHRPNYPFDAVWLHGAIADNQLLDDHLAKVVHGWNEHYAFPKLILCHNAEFFDYIDKHYGRSLPVVRGSAGDYWEDGAGSSAQETTLCRDAEQTLTRAEKCLALAQYIQPGDAYPAQAINAAWRNSLLYDEHTWGAYCSISQPDSAFTRQQWKIKAQFAHDASRQANSLLGQGVSALSSLVKTSARSLVVINSASWPRTDVVDVKLPPGLCVANPDIRSCNDSNGTLLLVKNVPPCGYRVLKLAPKTDGSQPRVEPDPGTTLESPFYRVRFDPVSGAMTSLFDKRLGRELVDARAPYRLNEYLYVAGGDGSRIVMNPNGPEPKLTVFTPANATLRRVRLGQLGERMIIESSTVMTPRLVTEVTLWNDLPRVDILNRVTKTQTDKKEAVYFAFPFQADNPTFRYECPDGIVDANTDMLPGACLDWFAVQDFVEVSSPRTAITWATPDAPLVCFQDINRAKWQTRLPMKTGHLYAYVMNNYWHTNYKAEQGGQFTFRFSISSRARHDNPASARFGWAASNPLQPVLTGPNPQGLLPGRAASLVQVSEPDVLLTAAKKPDIGEGLVLRFWEVGGRSLTAHVHLDHLRADKATACNLVEDLQGPLLIRKDTISVPIRAFGLATVRLQ